MSTYQGCEGEVIFNDGSGAQTVGEVTSISVTRTANNNTYKVFGDCNDKTENLSKGWSISLEGRYCNTDAGQVQIEEGKLLDMSWFPGGQAISTPPQFSGSIRIDEITLDASADETITFSLTATGDGAIVLANTY